MVRENAALGRTERSFELFDETSEQSRHSMREVGQLNEVVEDDVIAPVLQSLVEARESLLDLDQFVPWGRQGTILAGTPGGRRGLSR